MEADLGANQREQAGEPSYQQSGISSDDSQPKAEVGLVELLGVNESGLLFRLAEELFPPGPDESEPTISQSGAFEYVRRMLLADADTRLAYKNGLRQLLSDSARSDHIELSSPDLQAILDKAFKYADDLPSGLSGSLSPEAVRSALADIALFPIVLWQHLREGMFCDPRHGGNTQGIMWKWLGYSGPQLHGYTSSEALENRTVSRPLRVAADWNGVHE